VAITTLDGVIAGTTPPQDFLKTTGTMEAIAILHSLAYTSGVPSAAVAPSPGMAGAALTTYDGQIPFANPGAGNSYLSRLVAGATAVGALTLYDRLWHNSGIAVTTTTSQTVTSATWPARDRNGATSGDGVLVGLEVSTATTNVSPVTTITMSYTDEAGNSGRTATIPSFPASALASTFVPFSLDTGDLGVQSIQSVTLGTSLGAGAVHLVAYRPLAMVGVSTVNNTSEINAITGGFPRLYDNTVPFLLWRPTATATATVYGQLSVAQG
jgi:hypothetical protein